MRYYQGKDAFMKEKTMHAVLVPINDLKKPEYYEKQPVEGYEEFLDRSIESVGVRNVIIANSHPERRNVIINGVGVWEACKRAGKEFVTVIFHDVSLDVEKQLHGLLNKHASQLSREKFIELLGELQKEFISDYIEHDLATAEAITKVALGNDKLNPARVQITTDKDYLKKVNDLKEYFEYTSNSMYFENVTTLLWEVIFLGEED